MLKEHLERLVAQQDLAAGVGNDPISIPRRYDDPLDMEIAGVFAATLAYGRVSLFLPVLGRMFDHADSCGGPRAWVEGVNLAEELPTLEKFSYRFNKGIDHALLLGALRASIERHGSIAGLFEFWWGECGALKGTLEGAIGELREGALAAALGLGVEAKEFGELPGGIRHALTSPVSGSACKRWNLYLRWMVRPESGVDLGLFRAPPASALLIPLDVHIHRISRMVGLTRRASGGWKTAAEVTAALAAFRPEDPIHYDFALSHVGISGGCSGSYAPSPCDECGLVEHCTVARAARS